MRFVTIDNQPIEVGCQRVLHSIYRKLLGRWTVDAGKAVAKLIQDHISRRYPGSRHWDPRKVKAVPTGQQNQATVQIDIPGAGRAWHNVDIYPKHKQWLKIPFVKNMDKQTGTYVFESRKGKLLVANKSGILAVLLKHVHQNQDRRLMPTTDQIFQAAYDATIDKV